MNLSLNTQFKKVGISLKKLFIILFFIIGVFVLIVTNTSWLSFGEKNSQVKVTDKIDMIEIDVSGVSTTIIPVNQNNISTEYNGKGKVTVEESGNKIEVQFTSKNWFNIFSFFKKNDLTIYIPEDYDRDLAIDSGSGSLHFSGQSKNHPMQIDNFSLNMSSGNVQLSHLSTNHFEQDGSSGNVTIESLTTKTGSINMSSGNMDVRKYSGDVKATLSSGRLKLQMEKVTDDIDLEVNSGYAILDLPQDANFALNGKIGSGAITTDFPLTDSKRDKHNMKGIHGSGEHNINLDVHSGKIEVN